ncbi:hypothetical protein [Parachitinimonas caeni]|uniref:Uncharacterized protein n=1 Tax=Parachitinimonas caeni TaxID=3031301 RepID=A0ABT7DXZ3_9NEIS|nr:hypothetical protein [Parachitinimonas caeni]MDK2124937.1 hypothetical protein [Parachitinimonas caeni]
MTISPSSHLPIQGLSLPGQETSTQLVKPSSGPDTPPLSEARDSSALSGRRVSLRQGAPSSAPTALQQECRQRLENQQSGTIGKWLKRGLAAVTGIVVAVGTAVTAGLSAVLYLPAMGIAKLHDAFSSALTQAKQQANAMRSQLGQTLPNAQGVLEKRVQVKGTDGNSRAADVGSLMEEYRARLGANVNHADMVTYINMGQRIVEAIKAKPDYNGGDITVDGITVKPNLETTRAISWYMQAKAVADNAAPDREPAFVNRGSMLMEDPGGKLFKFLNSAPNTYGRASTHFNERSASPVAGPLNTGAAGMLAGLTGNQGAQRGIEDYDSRMPSGKGCLLFDKLDSVPAGGEPRLFMKWESVGTPTVFGGGTHADAESGWSGKVHGRLASVFRCIGHSVNFITSRFESGDHNWAVRREAVDKGTPKALLQHYTEVLHLAAKDFDQGEDWAKVHAHDAKKFGIALMADKLTQLKQQYEYWLTQPELFKEDRPAWSANLQQVNKVLGELTQLSHELGADLGLERRGAEVHVRL